MKKKPQPFVSVVVPVYGCLLCLDPLRQRISETMAAMGVDYELILVDDSSPDGAWALIGQLAQRHRNVKGIQLSRNFGQHHAICAGLDFARGDHIVVMDCDLQDDPAEIPRFYEAIQKGYDVVVGRRTDRQDNWLKRKTSQAFYRVLSFLVGTNLDPGIANFGMYRSNVIQAVRSMGDSVRFFPLMVQWAGFRTLALKIQHSQRHSGRSAYSWWRLLGLAVNVAITFSNKPLRIIVNLGFAISGLAAIYALFVLNLAMRHDIAVPGWTSVIISVWFLSGMQMAMGGIVGIYVGKIFDASKRRPFYLVRDSLNLPR